MPVQLYVPYDSDVMGTDVQTVPNPNGRLTILAKKYTRPEAMEWAACNFGYSLSAPAFIDSHFVFEFRTERDALMFKLFWC